MKYLLLIVIFFFFFKTWSSICVITISNGAGELAITDTEDYVPVSNLWTQNNAKLLQQLKFIIKEQLTGVNTYQKY